MKIKTKVVENKKAWTKMKSRLRPSKEKALQIGWFEKDVYGDENDNLQIAQVAQWNNEGSASNNVPPRPFLTIGFMTPVKKGMYSSYFLDSMKRIASGASTFNKEYSLIGNIASEDLKEVIEDWDTPPNTPKTKELKGFDNPLINTETMKDSVNFRIGKR